MFDELTEELLDLSAGVRGYGAAVYAGKRGRTGCSQQPLLVHDPLLHLHHALLVSGTTSVVSLPERPALHPWCRLVRDGGRYLLEHGGTVVTLEGRAAGSLLPRLLPLLDGTRTVDDLFAELGPKVAPAIENALVLLDANRLLVDGKGNEEVPGEVAAAAAFAATVTSRTSERAAATAIAESSVSVAGTSASAEAAPASSRRHGLRPRCRARAARRAQAWVVPRRSARECGAPEPPRRERAGARTQNGVAPGPAVRRSGRGRWTALSPGSVRLPSVLRPPARRLLGIRGRLRSHRARASAGRFARRVDVGLAGLAALIVLRWVTHDGPDATRALLRPRSRPGPTTRARVRAPRTPLSSLRPAERAAPSPWFEEST